jgi:SAM-dependent methyltransferase
MGSDQTITRIMKSYDHRYFERWYRNPRDRVTTQESLERKVRMAVSLTEFFLGRRIRTVVDVGCGEATWYPVLRRMRRDIRYVGIDSSDYVLRRFGRARNIRRGSLGQLHEMRLQKRVDLVVCADVLQYVPAAEIVRGLRAIRAILGGVAYLEAFTTKDRMTGDREGWHERSEATYRRLFGDAGLTQCGPYCWLNRDALPSLNELESA